MADPGYERCDCGDDVMSSLSTSVNPIDGYFKFMANGIPDWEVDIAHGLTVVKVMRRAVNIHARGIRVSPTSAVVVDAGKARDPKSFQITLEWEGGIKRVIRVPAARFRQLATDLLPKMEHSLVLSVMES